ncbi:Rrf2 family transcriptional regulator [Botrimarina sp.]|uniref:RrF2 family transcriptional regulator n=1 Tax=Botrimarina sp. TaxID=2795802 RepID=UPI0032EFC1C6
MSNSNYDPMLSQTVEYALRTVVHLAANAPDSCTTAQLSDATRAPAAYLSKVIQALVRAGLLQSQRGAGGGVALAVSPQELTILDVVNAVDPIGRIESCPLGIASHGKRLCPLHRRLDGALAAVETAFASTTLAEVLAEPTDSPPLCEGLVAPGD